MTKLTDELFRAAVKSLAEGATLKAVVSTLPVNEAAFRWRYKQAFGRPLRLQRKRPQGFSVPDDACVLAYMAGIIDGEGWITMSTTKSTGQQSWTAAFASTDRSVIDFFAKYGGRVYLRFDGTRRKGTLGSVKPQWTWSLHRIVDVIAFLTAILPFMVIKRAKAQECLDSLAARLAAHLQSEHIPTRKFAELALPVGDQ